MTRIDQTNLSNAAPTLGCRLLILIALPLVMTGCFVPSTRTPPADASERPLAAPAEANTADDLPAPYVIQPGDLIEVSVWKNADLSRTVLVRPDGRISLPLLNEISAAGRTAPELRDVLAAKLAEYVSNSEVSVIVHEVKGVAVSVIGEVRQPGRYALQNRTTVLDALAMAGGLTEFAADTITVLRSEGGQTNRLPFHYSKATSPDGAEENFVLRAGDIIIVR